MQAPRSATKPPSPSRNALLRRIVASRRPAVALLGKTGIGKSWLLAAARAEFAEPSFSVRCSDAGVLGLEPFSALLQQLNAANVLDVEWLDLGERADPAVDVRDALATAARRPVVLLIDDLHLAGEASIVTFEYCVDRLQDYPIRWCVAAAPGNARLDATLERMNDAALLAVWHLEPLSSSETHVLLRSLAPLIGDRTAKDLPASGRGLAVALAIADRALDIDTLSRVAGVSKERAARELPALETAGIVRAEHPGYAVNGQTARDACLLMASVSQRRSIHAALAGIEREPMRRAAHLEEAGAKKEAAALYFTIALDALASARFADAIAAGTGLHRVARASSKERAAAEAIEELIRRSGGAAAGNAIVYAGRAALDELLAPLRLDLRIRIESAYYAATIGFVPDRAAEAVALAALLESCRRKNVSGTAALHGILAKLYYGLNAPTHAAEELERGLVELQSEYDPRTGVRLRIDLGLAKAARGESVAALELIEAQIGRAFALGLNDELCSACCAAMYVLSALDRFEEAAYWGDYALAQPGPKSSRWVSILTYNLAGIDLQNGRAELTLGRLAALREGFTRVRSPDAPMTPSSKFYPSRKRIASMPRPLPSAKRASTMHRNGFVSNSATRNRCFPNCAAI
jgi:hypothetical protein